MGGARCCRAGSGGRGGRRPCGTTPRSERRRRDGQSEHGDRDRPPRCSAWLLQEAETARVLLGLERLGRDSFCRDSTCRDSTCRARSSRDGLCRGRRARGDGRPRSVHQTPRSSLRRGTATAHHGRSRSSDAGRRGQVEKLKWRMIRTHSELLAIAPRSRGESTTDSPKNSVEVNELQASEQASGQSLSRKLRLFLRPYSLKMHLRTGIATCRDTSDGRFGRWARRTRLLERMSG